MLYNNLQLVSTMLWVGSVGICHPPPKMATAENPTPGEATFDHVLRHGSLRFLACEQLFDIPIMSYNKGRSPFARTAWRSTHIFRREAGESMAPHWKRRVTEGWEADDSDFITQNNLHSIVHHSSFMCMYVVKLNFVIRNTIHIIAMFYDIQNCFHGNKRI